MIALSSENTSLQWRNHPFRAVIIWLYVLKGNLYFWNVWHGSYFCIFSHYSHQWRFVFLQYFCWDVRGTLLYSKQKLITLLFYFQITSEKLVTYMPPVSCSEFVWWPIWPHLTFDSCSKSYHHFLCFRKVILVGLAGLGFCIPTIFCNVRRLFEGFSCQVLRQIACCCCGQLIGTSHFIVTFSTKPLLTLCTLFVFLPPANRAVRHEHSFHHASKYDIIAENHPSDRWPLSAVLAIGPRTWSDKNRSSVRSPNPPRPPSCQREQWRPGD